MTERALPVPPDEVPRERRLSTLAPKFAASVETILVELEAAGHPGKVFETARTDARQAWLFGMGRDYDDGRGVVTKARQM